MKMNIKGNLLLKDDDEKFEDDRGRVLIIHRRRKMKRELRCSGNIFLGVEGLGNKGIREPYYTFICNNLDMD